MSGPRKPIVRTYDPNGTISLIESKLHGYIAGAVASSIFVCVGDTIEVEDQEAALRGHGTQLLTQGDEKKIVATLCGVVERVNKLVYVRPLKTRYQAQLGDVVVGRVTEVAGKKWKIDISAVQEASLLLSAVNLPGAIQVSSHT
jgi:exosome complex component RRP4